MPDHPNPNPKQHAPDPGPPTEPPAPPPRRAPIALDTWMAQHPWHPRVVPFIAYVALLPVIGSLRDLAPWTYPIAYTLQCAIVLWLLWRYRRLLPELTVHFHWLALPFGAAVAFLWIVMGKWMAQTYPDTFAADDPTDFFNEMGLTVGWLAMSLRLLGMSIVVPLFEELFIRSLLLRSFHSIKRTTTGVLQLLTDMPMIGEWLYQTKAGNAAADQGPVFGESFTRTPLGALSIFGVFMSTLVFTIHHTPRDWPGCVMCAIAYCFLLAATRSRGLGPVCWAHGITNALLWAYTIITRDWQFL